MFHIENKDRYPIRNWWNIHSTS